MPSNVVKYTTGSAPSNTIKKGNFYIGNNTGDYGATFYSGITPPSGGYTVYLNKASGGPSIYTPSNSSQLITLTNGLAGQTFANVGAALNWYNTQSDKVVFNKDYPATVTNGLVLNLDSGFAASYPTTGTTWYDLSSSGNNGTLTNGASFSSATGGSINLDGTDDFINLGSFGDFTSSSFSFSYWVVFNSLTTNQPNQGPVVLFKGQFQSAGYYDQIGQNGSIAFVTNQGGAYQATFTSAGAISAGTLYNISYTRSGSSVKIYLNGSAVTQTSASHLNPTTSGDSFRIGAYGSYIYSNVNVFSFLCYNRELTAAEVAQNYMQVLGGYLTDSDAIAYVNAVANNGGTITLTTAQKIQSFITYLKTGSPSGNQWQYLDRMWMFKNDSQQAALTSLRNPTSTMAETVNSPTFTVGAGFTLNGTNQYIKSNFIPSVNGSNFVFNGFFAGGMWQQTSNSTATWEALFGVNDGTNEFLIFPNNLYYGTNYNMSRAIGGAYQNSNTSVTSGRVWYLIKRSGGASTFERSNNDSSDGGLSGGGNITKQIYIGAYNDNNTAVGSYWGKSNLKAMEFIFLGGSSMDMNELIYAVNTYLI